MIHRIENLRDYIISNHPDFTDQGFVITERLDFKKNGISDKVKNRFYIRLANLDTLDDYKISKSNNGVKNITSKWVAVFQIESSKSTRELFGDFAGMICDFDGCISNLSMSNSTDKIYKSECKVKTKEDADGGLRYDFHLIYIAFDYNMESVGRLCLNN